MKWWISFSCFFFYFFFFSRICQGGRFYRFKYTVERSETFSSIVQKFTHNLAYVYANHKMVRLTQAHKYNKKIKNWKKLDESEKFILFINYQKADHKKILAYLKRNKVKGKAVREPGSIGTKMKSSKNMKRDQKLSIFGFYTVSKGEFSEKTSDGSSITNQELTPITFGMGLNFSFMPKHSISSSFYYSFPKKAVVSSTQQELDVPGELGLTAYYQYYLTPLKMGAYMGLDYESFGIFNSKEVLASNAAVTIDESQIIWATFGIAKAFKTSFGTFLTKVSFSKSFSENSDASIPYEGKKFLLYLNWKPHKKLLYHLLYKKHNLDGVTSLSVQRYGIGIGWSFI